MNTEIQRRLPRRRIGAEQPAQKAVAERWDEIDREIAARRIREIESDPTALVTGSELQTRLGEILG